jgi:hypothetical protein
MSLETLTLKLDGITAGDYLTWCRDPDPPALDLGLRSISIETDPLGDTTTATLKWEQPALAAATAAGPPLSAGVQVHARERTTAPLQFALAREPARNNEQIAARAPALGR